MGRTLIAAVGTQSNSSALSSDTIDDSLNDLKSKARTVFDGATILVSALVDYILEELVYQIAVRAAYVLLAIRRVDNQIKLTHELRHRQTLLSGLRFQRLGRII